MNIAIILLSIFCLWMIRIRYRDIKIMRVRSEEYHTLEKHYILTYEQMSLQVIAFDNHMKAIITLYGKIVDEIAPTNPELCQAINEGKLVIQRYREAYFDNKVEQANEFLKNAKEVKGMMK